MRSMLGRFTAALALAFAAAMPMAAQAEYPDKSMTLVVPWPPGGATDSLARIIAQKLGERVGQTIIVDGGTLML